MAAKKKVPETQDQLPPQMISEKHPSVDTTLRFSLDCLLRKHGFSIHSRKRKQEATWIRLGKIFKQSAAVKLLPKSEVADCKYAQDLYIQGTY